MNFLWNLISDITYSVANNASNRCILVFFEPKVPKFLREE